jgi:hypothetical protein
MYNSVVQSFITNFSINNNEIYMSQITITVRYGWKKIKREQGKKIIYEIV